MTDPDPKDKLAEVLVANNLVSQAQIELAVADQDIHGLPLQEILLVRGWITEEKLYEVAPWLKTPGKAGPLAKPTTSGGSSSQSQAKRPGGSDSTSPKSKPNDLPKEPPARPAGAPAVVKSPVSSNPEENLKAYRELMKKVLSVDDKPY
ncbi:MAG: hypothetical protein K2X27_08390 [Candidatus Obscuribacterales bacterium]|nr:hypothetical protein [Candidatus Obscuribacterales bacterium]